MSIKEYVKKRALERMKSRAHRIGDPHLELHKRHLHLAERDSATRAGALRIEGQFFAAMTRAAEKKPSLVQRLLRFW